MRFWTVIIVMTTLMMAVTTLNERVQRGAREIEASTRFNPNLELYHAALRNVAKDEPATRPTTVPQR